MVDLLYVVLYDWVFDVEGFGEMGFEYVYGLFFWLDWVLGEYVWVVC